MQNPQPNERYSRQIALKGFGAEGQSRLGNSSVLVIGAGGLGCPVLQYLAGAGVGTIGIADDDVVSLSNLHRQMLYTTDDIGALKVTQAAARLQRQNPEIDVHTYPVRVSNINALHLIDGYDIIVDGTDSFASRYMINDACVLLNKPLVYGAVFHYEGQVAVFNVSDESGNKSNYRSLFPTPPSALEAPGCHQAGALGILPGIIGIMQATEVIKLITGLGSALVNRLLTYNVLTAQAYTIQLTGSADADALIPKNHQAFMNTNYEWLCADASREWNEINNDTFQALKMDQETVVIDVREAGELPEVDFPHLKIPLAQLKGKLSLIQQHRIVVFCQTGGRSMQAAELLQNTFGNKKEIYSLTGGLQGLKLQEP